jgi:hypothetical protein
MTIGRNPWYIILQITIIGLLAMNQTYSISDEGALESIKNPLLTKLITLCIMQVPFNVCQSLLMM